MDFKTFKTELSKLTAIPEAEAQRAADIARHLSDADREGLIAQLRGVNEELLSVFKAQQKAVEEQEQFLMGAEKQMKKIARSDAESSAREEELSQAEEQIVNLS